MSVWDMEDGDFCQKISDNMLLDSAGNLMQVMSDNMAMDLESGELHFISGLSSESFGDDEEW